MNTESLTKQIKEKGITVREFSKFLSFHYCKVYDELNFSRSMSDETKKALNDMGISDETIENLKIEYERKLADKMQKLVK